MAQIRFYVFLAAFFLQSLMLGIRLSDCFSNGEIISVFNWGISICCLLVFLFIVIYEYKTRKHEG